ncbi:hypothetical protein BDZ45DRAFT_696406 [Acephala macrosclerotiorum]|nr:hypothetical protein BDZ45DRAFT_696406 [Acephala macrosclerotiorum]
MEDVLNSFNVHKDVFLNEIESNVRHYIESTGRQCIAIVEKDDDGKLFRTWEFRFNDDFDHYCKVLYKFTRKQQYHGHDLDSALTEPIANMVQRSYESFYESENEAISNGMLTMLAADDLKLNNSVDRLGEIAMSAVSSQVKKQLLRVVKHQIKESAKHGTLNAVGHNIGHLAATAAGTQVGVVVAHLLIKLLATNVGHIVTKFLASAAAKKMIFIIVKKYAITVVTGVVVNFLATHITAAVGGSSIMWIVAPILLVYITYEIATFPESLGKKVSKKIREELEMNFETTNKTILEKVFDSIFSGDELLQKIAHDDEFQEMVQGLNKEFGKVG